MKKVIIALLSIWLAISFFQINIYAYSGTFNLYHETPSGSHVGLYKYDNILYKYPEYGQKFEKYTGWTRTGSGKRRYYVTGDICKGWRKINGKWYYFDYSNGNAATGIKIIGGKIYIFNDDNSWSGKRSKSAKYPSDFSIKLIRSDMESETCFLISGKSKTLKITTQNKEITEKMSTADVQAFYSMVLDTGIIDIKSPVNGFHIENNYLLTGYTPPIYNVEDNESEPDEPADTDYLWTDPERYRFEISCDGESYTITGDDTAFLFAYTENTTAKFCHMIWLFIDYVAFINK